MTMTLGVLVFARYNSSRLPGKALRHVGGMALLERVIRRAQLGPWPVYLATTKSPSDDALARLATKLGVPSYRGSEQNVLERAIFAAGHFELDAFVRLCGDRPLFPLDSMMQAGGVMLNPPDSDIPDLVTNWPIANAPSGLTTEVIRVISLRRAMARGVSESEQEHITQVFYKRPEWFHIHRIQAPKHHYTCPGFAVDTEADLDTINRILSVCGEIDLSPEEADGIYTT